MIHFLSWPEGIACLLAVTAAAWPRRSLLLTTLGVVAITWIFGTAGVFLFPAAVGTLSLLLVFKSGRRWRIAGRFLAAGGAFFSILLCLVFPVPEAPVLTGHHPVGTLTVELPADAVSPTLVAQIWYPARSGGNPVRSRWLPDPVLAPEPPFHRISHAFSNATEGADLLDGPKKLPIVFYEHSWTGHRAENVAQVEAMASHGFVVVAVDHPGQAERVRYADGSVVPSRLPAQLDLSTDKAVSDFEALAEECLSKRIVEIARVRHALREGLAPKLEGRLALEQTGIFGFSFGGTCALRICSQDASFVAGANEDGFFLGEDAPPGPFLFFDQEMPDWLSQPAVAGEGSAEELTRKSEGRIRAAMGRPDRERVIVDGTRHESFCDRIFTCRIPRLARTGTRPAAEVHDIITSRLVAFFSTYLAAHRGGKTPTGE
ncbi:MAG: hypothetical protein EOP88_05650 [Verrucomicrobiaceae bacterium]|nr:MAG: hypothetical protein EOP88_05650 [Verrucomicrobiaceae bacterium]